MEDNKAAYIASQYKPKPVQPGPPGSGPGSQGNVNTNPADDWIGRPQHSSVYYGNLPQSQGNVNVNVSNPLGGNYQGPDITGGGGTGGDGGDGAGTDTGSGSSGGSGAAGSGMSGTELAALANAITGSNILEGGIDNLRELSQDTLSLSDKNTMNNLENLDTSTWSFGDPTKGFNWKITDPGSVNWNINENMGITANVDPFNQSGSLMFNMALGGNKAQGGPVGLMSLPQGYANGGEVIEGTDTMEELTPFGGTRERVIDQVEAFDNAPHHIEEPMIGMWGEKIPLTTARRVHKYMEGMDPVKRGLIEEMMQMFQMKKMQEKMQDQQQEGLYFGPQPKEYSI